MDGRRTYLDSLNVGRQRRATTTLDDLSRSLEQMGERLDRRTGAPQQPGPASGLQRHGWMPEDTPVARSSWRDSPPSRDDAYQATTGRLTAEVKGLRDEMRHQMNSGLQREFDSLRRDLVRAYSASGSGNGGKLAGELAEISESIRTLSSRTDDRGINLLRLDIEQLRGEIDALAREDTVRSMDSHWAQFDRRWNELEGRIDARPEHDPAMLALTERLQQVTEAVNNLPESLSLRSLEDKVRTLAGSVEHFAQQDGRAPQLFSAIEQRLDEISRAIVASAAAAQPAVFDFEPIDRIERRISSLAQQLDGLAARGAPAEIIDRLNALSVRIDDVARQSEVPARSVETLASQIALIAERMDQRMDTGAALPNADEIMRGIESRFDQFADFMEHRQDTAIETSQSMFRDLEGRLHDVLSRLDQAPERSDADNTGLIDAIDARLADFSRRIEERRVEMLDDKAVRNLEAKIDTISSRFDNGPASAPQVDPDAIRNLEAQIAGLSSFLSKADQPSQALGEITPRLDEMERAIRGNSDAVMDAARRAAEDVVRSFAGPQSDTTAVEGLAQDLKALESITKRSDDRNSKTFEAIHDTLLKIVDRLGSIEAPRTAAPVAEMPAMVAIKQTPPIAPTDLEDASEDDDAIAPPIEASDALDGEGAVAAKARRSMLGGLGSAFSRRKKAAGVEPTAPALAAEPTAAAPSVDLDQPLDPKIANRPLQPGSGAPDLSRIMQRVREERGQQPAQREDADTAKSDFIAAARRAAQAAAAEAEVLKRHSDLAGSARGKFGQLFKARRKPILMGAVAIMIALAGLHLGKAFLSDSNLVVGNNATAPAKAWISAPVEPNTDIDTVTEAAADTARVTANAAQDATDDIMPMLDDAPSADLAPPSFPVDAAAETVEVDAVDADEVAELAPDMGAATASIPASVPNPALPAASATPAALPIARADTGPEALRQAANAGDPKAMFEIGARYSEGRGTKIDNERAAEWYQRAAEQGIAPAQYRIGNMYEKGIGVERDLKKAKAWYQMAAEQGNASAMHNLAVLYAMGADGTTDNESAARWFKRAGELGVKDSQFNLGILNAKGVGMPQDLEESYKWFALVADTGDRDAIAKRDEIAKALRPEQLEKAQAATELWKAKTVDPATNVVNIPDDWQEGTEKTASLDMQKAVKTIQVILNKNGYDAGGADGVMGQKTRNAIIAFQKDNSLPADGQITEKLVQELLARK